MKTILIITMILFSGCAAINDDLSPREAKTRTTSELSYIYGSYGRYAYKLPNIRNELINRGSL